MKNNMITTEAISGALQSVLSHLPGGIRVIGHMTKSISPHVTAITSIVVKEASKKSEYLPDIHELYARGMPVKDISEKLGVSISYVYKLLKKD